MGVVGSMRARREIIGDGEAGDTGPAVADFEEFERVHKGVDLLFREILLEYDGENAGGADEVALPEFVAGAGRQRGMENKLNFRARGKPLG